MSCRNSMTIRQVTEHEEDPAALIEIYVNLPNSDLGFPVTLYESTERGLDAAKEAAHRRLERKLHELTGI